MREGTAAHPSPARTACLRVQRIHSLTASPSNTTSPASSSCPHLLRLFRQLCAASIPSTLLFYNNQCYYFYDGPSTLYVRYWQQRRCFRVWRVAESGKPSPSLGSGNLTASTSASTLMFPPHLPRLHRLLSPSSLAALTV